MSNRPLWWWMIAPTRGTAWGIRWLRSRPTSTCGRPPQGGSALRLARLQVDKAIVLDGRAPGHGSPGALRKLKDDPATHNIPVILKTAVYLDHGHREVASWTQAAAEYCRGAVRQAGAGHHLASPVLDDGASPGSPAKP